ncbi:MAG: SagB/ThcOx family dehydrogenase [Bacteroidales bacterium]|nr:SagB/ThcOx family dehydrogenase [Bacteroidales bacterium]
MNVSGFVKLPPPRTRGDLSLEETLINRRSRRYFQTSPLTPSEISQILWAAYGLKEPARGKRFSGKANRNCPSAGALFPLEIYLTVGDIVDIPSGFYQFIPDEHALKLIHDKDLREDLCKAAQQREMVRDAPASLIYIAIESRVIARYGERGVQRYIPMDIGHSAQNVYLQVEALGLGTCAIGAFNDETVKQVLDLPEEQIPMYIMPVGYPV